MKKSIHRRQFLKKGAVGIGALAVMEAFSAFSPVFAGFAKTDNASTTAKVLSREQRGGKTMKVLGIIGSSIAAARRAGTLSTLDTMNHFFMNHSMFVCGSSYWNFGYGRLPGDVLSDNEGIETMKNLGKNMAFILKAIGNM